MSDHITRRGFIKALGVAGAAAVVPDPLQALTASAQEGERPSFPQQVPPPTLPPVKAYTYLYESEIAFVQAAVARLIPADDLGPGASEAAVDFFIDQQLSGAYGFGATSFTGGPWAPGTASQGYQLPLNPRELYRIGINDVHAYCRGQYQAPFDRLTPEQQDEVLTGLEQGTIRLKEAPAQAFFEMLLEDTIQGFFADPAYGGNRDKVGWKLVGYPGVNTSRYPQLVTVQNEYVSLEPMSLVDMQQPAPPR